MFGRVGSREPLLEFRVEPTVSAVAHGFAKVNESLSVRAQLLVVGEPEDFCCRRAHAVDLVARIKSLLTEDLAFHEARDVEVHLFCFPEPQQCAESWLVASAVLSVDAGINQYMHGTSL
jgi:hypothetical protein